MRTVYILLGFLLFYSFAFSQRKGVDFRIPSPLTDTEFESLSASPDSMKKLIETSKAKIIETAKGDSVEVAASWLYTYFAAEFISTYAADIPFKNKIQILKNLTTFMDFYESILPDDKLVNVGENFFELCKNCPKEVERNLGLSFAISLVYDTPPAGIIFDLGMPASPTYLEYPTEAMLYISSANSPYDINKLAVCELVWIAATLGPLEELRSLRKDGASATYVERLQTLIRTDRNRLKKKDEILPWEKTIDYTPANILKYGGLANDKVYYSYRYANANLIPVICYRSASRTNPVLWLSYMYKLGGWKHEIGKSPSNKRVVGVAYNPQTWKLLKAVELERLQRRGFIEGNGFESRALTHISKMAYDVGELKLSETCAKKALQYDSLNSEAYNAIINIRARLGASEEQINELWRRKLDAFRSYPRSYIDVISERRDILKVSLKYAAADHFFWSHLRSALRADYDYALEVYMADIYNKLAETPSKESVLPFYTDVCRASWVNMRTDPLTAVVEPFVTELYQMGETVVADRAIAFYCQIVKKESSVLAAKEFRLGLRKTTRNETELEQKIVSEEIRTKQEKLEKVVKEKKEMDKEYDPEVEAAVDAIMAPISPKTSDDSGTSPEISETM